MWSTVLAAAGVLALAATAPFVLYPMFLMQALCFALFACAFNLLLGYVGLLSFGHAAYFGMAAYITGYAVRTWHVEPLLGILGGMAMAAVLGVVFGWLAIRRQGIYFSMITLALAQMLYFFCLQAPFTHGEDGLQGIRRGWLLGVIDLRDSLTMYIFVTVSVALALGALWRVTHSPFGQTLKAIRDNEKRAISLGYRVEHFKLLAFVISATLAGLAGSLKALVFGFASLTDVDWHMSGEVVLMTLLGGLGTVFGPVVGAFLLVTLQNYLAEAGAWVTIIQGITFVVVVLVFPRGLVGEILAFVRRGRVPRPGLQMARTARAVTPDVGSS
jgi:branched-chain amino acid transport system permease protein